MQGLPRLGWVQAASAGNVYHVCTVPQDTVIRELVLLTKGFNLRQGRHYIMIKVSFRTTSAVYPRGECIFIFYTQSTIS